MSGATRQANFLLPEELLEEMKKNVSPRQQSRFVAEAVRKELRRLRLEKALDAGFGAWKDEDHPELQEGTDSFVRGLRKSTRTRRH